jgi:threonine/homoserine/homoserine lactone efflux protein
MGDSRSEVLAESKRKGVVAGVTTAAAIGLGVVGWPVTAVIAGVPAVVLSYRWWKHRTENGIRF